jgi:fluoroquinolone resistance protein
MYKENQLFDKQDFSQISLEKGEYENCRFISCNFSNANLSNYKFIDCQFEFCNLSLCKMDNTQLNNIAFKECKMLGIHFDNCLPFGLSLSFNSCQLNHSSFYRLNLKKTVFRNCQLHEIDLTECDLTSAIFDVCDMLGAVFMRSILENADFRTAYNYQLDPEQNKIKKARFSQTGIAGLLVKYQLKIE